MDDAGDAGADNTRTRTAKSDGAFRTISEVADQLDAPQHVLRFWETKFTQVRPLKRAGGRRYYRPENVVLLKRIRTLLYSDGLTIKGVQKLLRETGVKAVTAGKSASASGLPRKDTVKLLAELTALRDDLRDAAQSA